MDIVWSRYITERTLLRGMQSGFALVLLLLSAAWLIAVRGTWAIRQHADTVVREELTIARLLNEVQAEEKTMTAAMLKLTGRRGKVDSPELVRELDEADQAIRRAAAAAAQSPDSAQWMDLVRRTKRFTSAALQALQQGELSEQSASDLFAKHDDVVRLVQTLVTNSTQRAITVDHQLSGRSKQLADESVLLLGLCFILALLSAIATIRMARQSVRRVEAQATELGRVSWHMLQHQEETARRFSHELHDELGQSLAAIRANIEGASISDFQLRRSDCLHLVDEAIANVRELSQLLRPVILDDFGLDAALRWLTEKFAQRTNIAVRYHSTLTVRLEEQCETHLFRIAQEALTNIARHSEATEVEITLHMTGAGVTLRIEDNGRGLPKDDLRIRSSLGMVGMRARAREAGGELTVESLDRSGVAVTVSIPKDKLACAAAI
jgi:signal transduction histidine kinase